MKRRTSIACVAVAACASVLSACTTVITRDDESVVASSMGSLQTTASCTPEEATTAAREVLKEAGFALTNEQAQRGRHTLTARGSMDRKTTVQVESVSGQLTSIRIGGADAATQLLLLNEVRKRVEKD